MLPVFEGWARVVELAEVSARMHLCTGDKSVCIYCAACIHVLQQLHVFAKSILSLNTGGHGMPAARRQRAAITAIGMRCCLVPLSHMPYLPHHVAVPQELPTELTEEQACSPACAELVGGMAELLSMLLSLSHLDDAGPQQVGHSMHATWQTSMHATMHTGVQASGYQLCHRHPAGWLEWTAAC